MQTVMIRFVDNHTDAKGFYELMKNTRVLCLPDDVLQIPESALKILDKKGFKYKILGKEGLDSVYKKVRDLATSKVR